MQKWEYKFLWIDIHMSPVLTMARWGVNYPGEKRQRQGMEKVEEYVCELGGQGWELVSVIDGTDHAGVITRAVLFFKRPATEQSAPAQAEA